VRSVRAHRAAGPCGAPARAARGAGEPAPGAMDRRASRAARRTRVDRRGRALRLPGWPRSASAALGPPHAGRMDVPSPRRTPQAVAPLPDGQPPLRVASDLQPKKGAVVTESRLVILEQDGQTRSARLRDLVGRVAGLGWLEGAVSRAILHVGSCGRSALALETGHALATALRERSPALRLDALDPASSNGEWSGVASVTIGRAASAVRP